MQIHACHGPTRQVEVLRECLLHLFQDDPTLEPRDVVVMCPDVETYAPSSTPRSGRGPVTRDTRCGCDSPIVGCARPIRSSGRVHLLGLADARVTASEVLDLAASAPVRRGSGSTTMISSVFRNGQPSPEHAGVSVPVNAAAFGLGDFPQNTFGTALDRILLGVAADESGGEWLSLALPLDDVDSNDIDLAGRFAEYIDRLTCRPAGLAGPHPAENWSAALSRRSTCSPTSPRPTHGSSRRPTVRSVPRSSTAAL